MRGGGGIGKWGQEGIFGKETGEWGQLWGFLSNLGRGTSTGDFGGNPGTELDFLVLIVDS